MVGRHKELEMLDHALDRVLTERTTHLFTLLGPAGVVDGVFHGGLGRRRNVGRGDRKSVV